MKIGRVIKYLSGAIVILVVAVAVVLTVVDFNDYKPELQAQVKQATGRDLTIEGDIELSLSLTPSLSVGGVSFANADWGSRPAMATIERFEVQVALLPLISGTIDIQKLVLKGADILLETDAEGRPNYVFSTAPPDKAGDTAGAPTIPVLRHVTIENARVSYKDGTSNKIVSLVVDDLTLKGDGADAPVEISFSGSYNDQPISATGTLGPASVLLAAKTPYPISLTADAGGAKLDLKGAIADIMTAPKLDLALSVDGESTADLPALAGAAIPPLGPYRVKAHVAGDIGAKLTLSDFSAKVGGSDVSGALSIDLGSRIPAIDEAFKSTRIDVADFVKPGRPDSDTAETKDDGKVFSDDPLPLDGLKAVDAIIEISVETLIAALEAKNVEIGLYLKGGDLRITPLKAVASDGMIDGSMRLNASSDTPVLNTALEISKFDGGKFLTDIAITDLLEGRFNAKIELEGEGKSIRAIMASLSGQSQIAMGKGRMKSTALETFIGGPTKVLAKLVSGDQKEFTVINCMVSHFDIKNGLATSKTLLFDTEYATISGKGSINLASETLDLEIDPQPKSVTVNTAVPVVITGSFAEPSYGVSKLAAARKVGGLLGAFVFPPALIVGLVETGTGEENPCLKGGKRKPAARQAAPKESEEETSNPLAQPFKSIEKGVGGVLKRLFGN